MMYLNCNEFWLTLSQSLAALVDTRERRRNLLSQQLFSGREGNCMGPQSLNCPQTALVGGNLRATKELLIFDGFSLSFGISKVMKKSKSRGVTLCLPHKKINFISAMLLLTNILYHSINFLITLSIENMSK